MATFILTKADFLQHTSDLIKDGQFVVVTGDLVQMEDVPKKKVKRIQFEYASSAFRDCGIRPFMGENGMTISLCVADMKDIAPEHLTQEEKKSASLDTVSILDGKK